MAWRTPGKTTTLSSQRQGPHLGGSLPNWSPSTGKSIRHNIILAPHPGRGAPRLRTWPSTFPYLHHWLTPRLHKHQHNLQPVCWRHCSHHIHTLYTNHSTTTPKSRLLSRQMAEGLASPCERRINRHSHFPPWQQTSCTTAHNLLGWKTSVCCSQTTPPRHHLPARLTLDRAYQCDTKQIINFLEKHSPPT